MQARELFLTKPENILSYLLNVFKKPQRQTQNHAKFYSTCCLAEVW